jgi:hypothetical protein
MTIDRVADAEPRVRRRTRPRSRLATHETRDPIPARLRIGYAPVWLPASVTTALLHLGASMRDLEATLEPMYGLESIVACLRNPSRTGIRRRRPVRTDRGEQPAVVTRRDSAHLATAALLRAASHASTACAGRTSHIGRLIVAINGGDMSVREIIERHPRPVSLDRDLLLRCIDECLDCAATCNACADACLGEPDVGELVRCVRLNLDCADVCGAVSRMLSRQTEMDLGAVRAALEACIVMCRVCGDECERHAAHHDHCRVCAELCRRCEQVCRDLLASIG